MTDPTPPPGLDPLASLSPRAVQIVGAARVLLERDGWDAVSMHTVADSLGIRAPSLYKHLRGRSQLHAVLVGLALLDMGAALRRAGPRPVDLLAAYRAEALAHPHAYRLATQGVLARDALPTGLEDWAGRPFFDAAGADPHRAQALWAMAHGLTILELDGRFPGGRAADETWDAAAALFATGAPD